MSSSHRSAALSAPNWPLLDRSVASDGCTGRRPLPRSSSTPTGSGRRRCAPSRRRGSIRVARDVLSECRASTRACDPERLLHFVAEAESRWRPSLRGEFLTQLDGSCRLTDCLLRLLWTPWRRAYPPSLIAPVTRVSPGPRPGGGRARRGCGESRIPTLAGVPDARSLDFLTRRELHRLGCTPSR